MALRAVLDHPKFSDLKSMLNLSRFQALGCLEALWHFTGRYSPQGNIGKFTDSQIESWLEWDGEKGALIAALVASKWVDEDPNFRLLVHDWETHADKATKQALGRSKLAFCVPTVHTPGAHNAVLSTPPVPESGPCAVPESGAESGALSLALAAPPVRAVVEIIRSVLKPIPADAEKQIRAVADQAPDQQDHETGVRLAVQELISSANPETTLAAMLDNIPLWWAAMRDGRARVKPLRFVIADRDYLKRPREPTKAKTQSFVSQREQERRAELMRD